MPNKKSEKKSKREFDPIRPQTPSYKNIMCKDCKYRDKTYIVVGGIRMYVGITRDTCERYKGESFRTRKPREILFDNDICQYYQEDK